MSGPSKVAAKADLALLLRVSRACGHIMRRADDALATNEVRRKAFARVTGCVRYLTRLHGDLALRKSRLLHRAETRHPRVTDGDLRKTFDQAFHRVMRRALADTQAPDGRGRTATESARLARQRVGQHPRAQGGQRSGAACAWAAAPTTAACASSCTSTASRCAPQLHQRPRRERIAGDGALGGGDGTRGLLRRGMWPM